MFRKQKPARPDNLKSHRTLRRLWRELRTATGEIQLLQSGLMPLARKPRNPRHTSSATAGTTPIIGQRMIPETASAPLQAILWTAAPEVETFSLTRRFLVYSVAAPTFL